MRAAKSKRARAAPRKHSRVYSLARKLCWMCGGVAMLYAALLAMMMHPWLQRQALYAHSYTFNWGRDIDQAEQFGFLKNQATPFHLATPDQETLYAWHVSPLALYAEHEEAYLRQPLGMTKDITQTIGFRCLRDDPAARLVILFHGNSGTVAQGWRPDSYRSMSNASPSTIHILSIDYRGFGKSTGSPSEPGLIIDGIAAVDWALNVARVPAERIVVIGQSLGTAVAAAVAEHFAEQKTELGGVVLVAGFNNFPDLLLTYAIRGYLPVLSPLRRFPQLQRLLTRSLVDTWPSAERISNYMRLCHGASLSLVHAKDDADVPWIHSDILFTRALNATNADGFSVAELESAKARSTSHGSDGSSVALWSNGSKSIRQMILAHGGHNRIMTSAVVSLAIARAFNI